MHPSIQNKSHAKTQSRKAKFVAMLLLMLFVVPATWAQEVADTIRVRTRVVFMDALVKDKKTGIPISDLKPENFELFDDGKPRTISYFTRDGQARKPLAMMIILDCREDGAGRFLKRRGSSQGHDRRVSQTPARRRSRHHGDEYRRR